MKSCTDTQPLPQWPLQVAWLLGLLAACFGAAGLGGAVTATSVGHWYQTLAKPTWSPPDGIFGPVWTVLYFLMAIAAWLVWRRGDAVVVPMALFGIQLVFNAAWSWLFFGLHSPGAALIDISGGHQALHDTAVATLTVPGAAAAGNYQVNVRIEAQGGKGTLFAIDYAARLAEEVGADYIFEDIAHLLDAWRSL